MRAHAVLLWSVVTSMLIAGCASNPENPNQKRNPTTALFDPGNAVVPFPTNLLFQGSEDGTLNISDGDDLADPQVALSTLDGFSLLAPFSTRFSSALDPASVVAGATMCE